MILMNIKCILLSRINFKIKKIKKKKKKKKSFGIFIEIKIFYNSY